MGTNIAHASAVTTFLRISPPCSLRIAFTFTHLTQPSLWIFHPDLSDLSKSTTSKHGLSLLNHWITRIGMCKAEDQTGLLGFFLQLQCFIKSESNRLLNHNME